jgi:hypothetical protein
MPIFVIGCDALYGFRIEVHQGTEASVRVVDTKTVNEKYDNPIQGCRIRVWSKEGALPAKTARPSSAGEGVYQYGAHGTPFMLAEKIVEIRSEKAGYEPTVGRFKCSAANMKTEKTILILMVPKQSQNGLPTAGKKSASKASKK